MTTSQTIIWGVAFLFVILGISQVRSGIKIRTALMNRETTWQICQAKVLSFFTRVTDEDNRTTGAGSLIKIFHQQNEFFIESRPSVLLELQDELGQQQVPIGLLMIPLLEIPLATNSIRWRQQAIYPGTAEHRSLVQKIEEKAAQVIHMTPDHLTLVHILLSNKQVLEVQLTAKNSTPVSHWRTSVIFGMIIIVSSLGLATLMGR